jgi:hypothetical protein
MTEVVAASHAAEVDGPLPARDRDVAKNAHRLDKRKGKSSIATPSLL